jgi:6-pyruvoyltetrahydropterin/6-carboxytetrahydropterin synthase
MKNRKTEFPHGIMKLFYFTASHSGNFAKKDHPDNKPHSHDWKVIFRCKSEKLNKENVVVDFRIIDGIKQKLEGKNLNNLDIFKGETVTTEFLAEWICNQIPKCFLVEVFETEDNMAWYQREIV